MRSLWLNQIIASAWKNVKMIAHFEGLSLRLLISTLLTITVLSNTQRILLFDHVMCLNGLEAIDIQLSRYN